MPSVITLLMTKPESLDSWWSADENLSVKKALPHVEAGAADLGGGGQLSSKLGS